MAIVSHSVSVTWVATGRLDRQYQRYEPNILADKTGMSLE